MGGGHAVADAPDANQDPAAVAVGRVWPMPREYQVGSGVLVLTSDFRLNCRLTGGQTGVGNQQRETSDLLLRACERYQRQLTLADGQLPEAPAAHAAAANSSIIDGQLVGLQLDEDTDESYQLAVDVASAQLTATSVFGALRGLETFLQLVQLANAVAQRRYLSGVPLRISDRPAFAHRGLMLDTARTYFPVADILRQLDAMASTKLNVFHWHIVDAQSFPLASEALPELSEKGAYAPDLVYTRQDVDRVVQYARDRGIRVIPEFDTPGHAYAWGLAYPELSVCMHTAPDKVGQFAAEPPAGQLDPTKEATMKLVETLISEQAVWFPDRYIHLGGDEVNAACYEQDPHVAAYLRQHSLTVPKLIERYGRQMHDIARRSGKRVVTWEEMLLEYDFAVDPISTLVQVWRGASSVRKVVQRGRRAITSPADHWYLDCGQGAWVNTHSGGDSWCDPYKTWQHMYTYDPLAGLADTGNTDTSHPAVAGGEVTMWTEKTDTVNLDIKVWPRAAAAAEVLWSGRRDVSGRERTTHAAHPRIHRFRRRLLALGLRPDMVNMLWCEKNPAGCEAA
ncbi:N-acetylhexosaminidase [Thamnocephalis sphaerospora]|uniref:Beta-hexosaminidase n=1 Tax=Thamnocephalis sphaerospora TaxID=78915 RepID=A0A4P9XPX3_9FUNG|nr:N-acetylhexosaminidase [Thamnocephalis sphaerospora]|eukprot:RKP08074.1 N-acetylhexosaminidase [Thamnocephalis sphaerospora]